MKEQHNIQKSWQKNRIRYNIALIIAGFLAFISYCILGSLVIPSPYFEITIFTTIFQGIMYIVMMGIANVGYTLFMYIDHLWNRCNVDALSHKIIFYGYWGISCVLPFSISILLYVLYRDGYPQ